MALPETPRQAWMSLPLQARSLKPSENSASFARSTQFSWHELTVLSIVRTIADFTGARMRRVGLALCAGMVLAAISAAAQANNQKPDLSKWTLVWSDEFNGLDGSPADSSKWVLETGGDGWGNQELEYYTTSPQNSYQEGGNLVIKAARGEIHRRRQGHPRLHLRRA